MKDYNFVAFVKRFDRQISLIGSQFHPICQDWRLTKNLISSKYNNFNSSNSSISQYKICPWELLKFPLKMLNAESPSKPYPGYDKLAQMKSLELPPLQQNPQSPSPKKYEHLDFNHIDSPLKRSFSMQAIIHGKSSDPGAYYIDGNFCMICRIVKVQTQSWSKEQRVKRQAKGSFDAKAIEKENDSDRKIKAKYR